MEIGLENPKRNNWQQSRFKYVFAYGLIFLILALSLNKHLYRTWPRIRKMFATPAAAHVNQLPADVREILERAETMDLIRFTGVETLEVNNFNQVPVQERATLTPVQRERVRLCIDQGILNHFGVEPTIHFKPAYGIRAVANGKSAGLIFGDDGMLLIYLNDQSVDGIRTSTAGFETFAEILKKQE